MFWEIYTGQYSQTRGWVEPVLGHCVGKLVAAAICYLVSQAAHLVSHWLLPAMHIPVRSDLSFLLWSFQLQDSFSPTSLKSLVSLPNRKVRSYTFLHRAHKNFWLSFMWHGYWKDPQAFLLTHYLCNSQGEYNVGDTFYAYLPITSETEKEPLLFPLPSTCFFLLTASGIVAEQKMTEGHSISSPPSWKSLPFISQPCWVAGVSFCIPWAQKRIALLFPTFLSETLMHHVIHLLYFWNNISLLCLSYVLQKEN